MLDLVDDADGGGATIQMITLDNGQADPHPRTTRVGVYRVARMLGSHYTTFSHLPLIPGTYRLAAWRRNNGILNPWPRDQDGEPVAAEDRLTGLSIRLSLPDLQVLTSLPVNTWSLEWEYAEGDPFSVGVPTYVRAGIQGYTQQQQNGWLADFLLPHLIRLE